MKYLSETKNKLLLCILMAIIVLPATAQRGKLYDADNYLSSSFTSGLYLDHDGFLYIATRNGLNRYDGYNFRKYRKGEPGCDGMMSNHVNTLIQASDGTFYVGFFSGVQAYYDDKFHNVTLRNDKGEPVIDYINSIIERRNGDILIATSVHGIFRLTSREEAVPLDESSGLENTLRIHESNDGNLWVVTTNQGIAELTGHARQLFLRDKGIRSSIKCICEDNEGSIYIGTAGYGLYRKKPEEDVFKSVEKTAGMHISEVFHKSDGNIILGFDGNGIGVYNPTTGNLTMNPISSNELEISHAKVLSIVEDFSGNIWLGFVQKGVYMHPGSPSTFKSMGRRAGANNLIGDCCVLATYIDSHGDIWVGTDRDGLYELDSSLSLKRHLIGNGIPSTIFGITEDKEGMIWVSSFDDGAGCIERTTGAYHKVAMEETDNYQAFCIKSDNADNIWIATMGSGLIRHNVASKETTQWEALSQAYGDSAYNGLPNAFISQLDVSPAGDRVYLATTMGLCCYDVTNNSWTSVFGSNIIKPGNAIHCVSVMGDSCLWYGTMDQLNCYDLRTKENKEYTTADGLTDNSISAIQPDGRGNIWVSTLHGLNCIDLSTRKVISCYYVSDGLQGNEFSDGASSIGSDGIMVFGGTGGISWFNPADLIDNEWKPQVMISNFLVGGVPVSANDKSGRYTIMKQTARDCDEFHLSPSDNTFTIQLSTLTFETPDNIIYSYSINDDEWMKLEPGHNSISISRINSGTYKFRVKATKNGLDSQIKEFTVKVHNPWYLTIWAFLGYLLIIILLIMYYLHQRKAKEAARMRLQEYIHAEEMSEAKVRFFINISHEIRTPMTLIVSPLLTLMKEDKDSRRNQIYETIKRNAERILHLINQLMDLRKIEKGQMAMHMKETDMVGFIREIYSLFDYKAKNKKIHFSFVSDVDVLPVWIDRENFDKVLINLLSNAFKFTPTGGRIDIRLGKEEGMMRLEVMDNGESIPSNMLEKIFERFYQGNTKTTELNFGTGVGLDLTRSIVELHHGTIKAENNADGQGCNFIVRIPLGKDHLTEEELKEVPDNDEYIREQLLEPTPTETTDNESEKEDTSGNGKPTVVIAEDDTEIQDYLKEELKALFNVRVYGNGKDALVEILKDVPDLVISDVAMPGMDGIMLCSKLKSNANTNSVPVILLTGKDLEQDQLTGLQTGADIYMTKPFNMEILKNHITNLINSRMMLKNKYSIKDKLTQEMSGVALQSPDEKLLQSIMQVINTNLNNPSLSVDMIAKRVGMSRVHLYRKMKEITGQSPHSFIRTLRLKQAARLLANPHHNITDVMFACGFNSSAAFSTAFKSLYGRSPREYQKQLEEEKEHNKEDTHK